MGLAEVRRAAHAFAREFTIATVPARFARLGDLHRGIDDTAYPLDTLLHWADRDGLDLGGG